MIHFLKSSSFRNKTVLLRVDVNVPLDDKSRVVDGFRIDAILPTIHFLRDRGCKVIVCGHLGRPDPHAGKLISLKPVAALLAEKLGVKMVQTAFKLPKYDIPHLIFFTGNIQEEASRVQVQKIAAGDIIFLENLRNYTGEEVNDAFFARQLAGLAEVYVNDAFAVSHRPDASVAAVAKFLPSYGGLVMEKEIHALSRVLEKPRYPFVCMIGGIKISDKVKTIEHLADRADTIMIGGGIANLIFKARGFEVGLSKVEDDALDTAWQIDRNLKDKIVLPVDAVVANAHMEPSSIRVAEVYDVRKREIILDVGPKTILQFAKNLKKAQTIVWNGPLGHFEVKPFDTGTMALARVIGGVATGKCFAVAGGGETVDAIDLAGQARYFDHLSTGGGAMLEYLAGTQLVGISALDR